jgi:hypothetical protein
MVPVHPRPPFLVFTFFAFIFAAENIKNQSHFSSDGIIPFGFEPPCGNTGIFDRIGNLEGFRALRAVVFGNIEVFTKIDFERRKRSAAARYHRNLHLSQQEDTSENDNRHRANHKPCRPGGISKIVVFVSTPHICFHISGMMNKTILAN